MQSELEENSQIAKRCKDREGREAERERERKKSKREKYCKSNETKDKQNKLA